MTDLLTHTLALYVDAAPWLLLGLLVAGLIKGLVPADAMGRWLGGRGLWPVVKGALIGAPLPLCSCSVLPAAVALRRAGASRGATVSFLVATPETGVDSVAVSWALLGPFLTVVRPLAAVLSAIAAGLLADRVPGRSAPLPLMSVAAGGGCGCSGGCAVTPPRSTPSLWLAGLRYAFTDLVDDLAPWLGVGLLAAGAVAAFVPPQALAAWGSGPLAYLAMLLVGVPMYICATASTPVAAGLLLAGVSPGAVLVFLLAGPATNMGAIALLKRELGGAVVAAYLAGIAGGSLLFGWLTDLAAARLGITASGGAVPGAEMVPEPLALACALLLALLALKPLRRRVPGLAPA